MSAAKSTPKNTSKPKRTRNLCVIDPDGTIRAIWSDDLAPFLAQGVTSRASHVEPCIHCEEGGWCAIIIGYDVHLGPFPLRQQALDAEIAYLEKQLYGETSGSG